MKRILRKHWSNIALLASLCLLSFSCDQEKPKEVNASNSTEKQITETIIKSDSSKIIGRYYVNDYFNSLRNGFELKLLKPEEDFILYAFEFKSNGKIVFEDLTESYYCGNGVKTIYGGNWENNEIDNYTIEIRGGYLIESYKFRTIAQYQLLERENGNKFMKLIKVIDDN